MHKENVAKHYRSHPYPYTPQNINILPFRKYSILPYKQLKLTM